MCRFKIKQSVKPVLTKLGNSLNIFQNLSLFPSLFQARPNFPFTTATGLVYLLGPSTSRRPNTPFFSLTVPILSLYRWEPPIRAFSYLELDSSLSPTGRAHVRAPAPRAFGWARMPETPPSPIRPPHLQYISSLSSTVAPVSCVSGESATAAGCLRRPGTPDEP